MEVAVGIAIGLFLAIGFTVFSGAPYVPSQRRYIRQAFTDLYPLGEQDTLVDLGSGDGVVMRIAREFGATTIGYELSPPLVLISKLLARGDKKQVVINASYWHAEFPRQTTVVYAFSDSRDINKVYSLVQREAGRLEKPLALLTYGIAVAHKTSVKKHGAYFLYTVAPCDDSKA